LRILKNNIVIGVIGITVGAAVGYVHITKSNTADKTNADVDSVTSLSEQAVSERAAVTNDSNLAITPLSENTDVRVLENKELSSDSNTIGDSNADSDFDESIAQSESVKSHKTPPPDSLLSALSGLTYDMIVDGTDQSLIDLAMQQVATWFENSPNPARDIFDLLASDASDENKATMSFLVANRKYEGLTENILNEMSLANESEQAEWQEIVGLITLDSPSERELMLDVLPNLSSETLVSATLDAVQPHVLPLEERSQFLEAIAPYANSDSEDVQASAMIALANFSGHDYSYMIEDALTSGSEQMKGTAIYAASVGGMRSDAIKNQISAILQDESASLALRTDAFDALGSFNLDEQEYNQYYEFYRVNILPLEKEVNRG